MKVRIVKNQRVIATAQIKNADCASVRIYYATGHQVLTKSGTDLTDRLYR
jgi:hypothetical protein